MQAHFRQNVLQNEFSPNRVGLQKGRIHIGLDTFFLFVNMHRDTKGRKFRNYRIKIMFQRKGWIDFKQRKVKVFGISIQTMENAKCSTAIKRCLFEKTRPLQTGERYFLHNLSQGIKYILLILGIITVYPFLYHNRASVFTRISRLVRLGAYFSQLLISATFNFLKLSSSIRISSTKNSFTCLVLLKNSPCVIMILSQIAFSVEAIMATCFSFNVTCFIPNV